MVRLLTKVSVLQLYYHSKLQKKEEKRSICFRYRLQKTRKNSSPQLTKTPFKFGQDVAADMDR